jgi:hypothetical protein
MQPVYSRTGTGVKGERISPYDGGSWRAYGVSCDPPCAAPCSSFFPPCNASVVNRVISLGKYPIARWVTGNHLASDGLCAARLGGRGWCSVLNFPISKDQAPVFPQSQAGASQSCVHTRQVAAQPRPPDRRATSSPRTSRFGIYPRCPSTTSVRRRATDSGPLAASSRPSPSMPGGQGPSWESTARNLWTASSRHPQVPGG